MLFYLEFDLSTSRNSLISQTFIVVPSKYRNKILSSFSFPFVRIISYIPHPRSQKKRESCITRTRLSSICSLEITVKCIFLNTSVKKTSVKNDARVTKIKLTIKMAGGGKYLDDDTRRRATILYELQI